MKKILIILPLALAAFSCHRTKTLEEYRAEAAAADSTAIQLELEKEAIENQILTADTGFYYGGLMTGDKSVIEPLVEKRDSIELLIHEQLIIINRCNKECDSIYHKYPI